MSTWNKALLRACLVATAAVVAISSRPAHGGGRERGTPHDPRKDNSLAQRFRRALPEKDYGVRGPAHVVLHDEILDPRVIHELRELRKPGLHVGTAGLGNLDLANDPQVTGLVLFDVNTNQGRFWRPFMRLVGSEPNRHRLPDVVKGRLHELPELRMNIDWLGRIRNRQVRDHWFVEELRLQLRDPDRWLGTDASYALAHERAKTDRVIDVNIGIADLERWKRVGRWLQGEGLAVSSFNASNLRYFAAWNRKQRDAMPRSYYADVPAYTRLEMAESVLAGCNGDRSALVVLSPGMQVMTAGEFWDITDSRERDE